MPIERETCVLLYAYLLAIVSTQPSKMVSLKTLLFDHLQRFFLASSDSQALLENEHAYYVHTNNDYDGPRVFSEYRR